jgi:hypothetical protein
LHSDKLLSIDNTRRVQAKGSEYQWLGHQHNLFHLYGNHFRLAEFTLPEKADLENQADSFK